MIGFVIGTVVGIPVALIYGRFKGRAGELLMATMIPFLTYTVCLLFYGNFDAPGTIVAISTPFGSFAQDRFMVGVDTFLATLVSLGYLMARSKGALTIDEFPGVSLFLWMALGMDVGLMATAGWIFLLLGVALLVIEAALSFREPLRGLNAVPCDGELKGLSRKYGVKCLTDDGSFGIYKIRDTVVIGGKLVEEFPHWRELAKCMLEMPDASKIERVTGYGIAFLPGIVGVTMRPGLLALISLSTLSFLLVILWGSNSARRTRGSVHEGCREVVEEWKGLYRRKAKEMEGKSIVID